MTLIEALNILSEENCDQNNLHHNMDVKHHSIATMYGLLSLGHNINQDNLSDIMIAALFHDIGKKQAKGINSKTGYDTFYGHPKKSIDVLKEKGVEISSLTAFLIEHHDDRMMNRKPECTPLEFVLLGELMFADLKAQHPTFQHQEKIQEFFDWFHKYV